MQQCTQLSVCPITHIPAQIKADVIALAVMIYALVVYHMRAKAIRLRTGAPYDDRLGPVSSALCERQNKAD